MIFTKIIWSDKKPAIDVAAYDYSTEGFATICGFIQHRLNLKAVGSSVIGLDTFIQDFEGAEGPVDLHMDNYTCSFAFASEEARDKAFGILSAY